MEQSKIWDHFQADESAADIFSLSTPRYRFLASKTRPGSCVLNIGVGRGGLERLLLKRGVDTHCLDPGDAAIKMVQEQLELGEKAKVGWSQAIPFSDETFDMVIMSEVLEHLESDVLLQTLNEVRRILKPSGQLIGTVPADENLADGQVLCPHCGEKFHRWGHAQSFNHGRLHKLLAQQFCLVRVSRHYFGDWQHLNWKGRVNWIIKKCMLLLGVRGSVENYFFVAHKGKP